MTEFADRDELWVRTSQYNTVIPNFITARLNVTKQQRKHQLSVRKVHDCYIKYCEDSSIKPLPIKYMIKVLSEILYRDYKIGRPERVNWEKTGDNEEPMRSIYGVQFKKSVTQEEIDEIYKGLFA